MKKLVLVLFTIVLLGGCLPKMGKLETPKKTNQIKIDPVGVWAYQLPQNNKYVVGIARKSDNIDNMTDSAQQMAAIMMNRNKNSFVIKNYAAIESERIRNSGNAQFELNVGSTKHLRKIYKSLELVDYSMAYGYFIGLFSVNGAEAPSKAKIQGTHEVPAWFEENKFQDSSNTLICHTTSTSRDLKTAWEAAAEMARQQFAEYLMKSVQSRILADDSNVRSDVAVETRLLLKNIQISKSYFIPRCINGTWRYDVYFEIIMEK